MDTHEMWSHKFMRIITPERELQGTEFRSNEQMTKYEVSNSAGAFPVSDTETEQPADTASAVPNGPPSSQAEEAPAATAPRPEPGRMKRETH